MDAVQVEEAVEEEPKAPEEPEAPKVDRPGSEFIGDVGAMGLATGEV